MEATPLVTNEQKQQHKSLYCNRPDLYQRTSSSDTNKTSSTATSTTTNSSFCEMSPAAKSTFVATTPVIITTNCSDDCTVRATGGSNSGGASIHQKAIMIPTSSTVLVGEPKSPPHQEQQRHTRHPNRNSHALTHNLSPTSVAILNHQRPESYRYYFMNGSCDYNSNIDNSNDDDEDDDNLSIATAASGNYIHEELLLPTPTSLAAPSMTHQHVNLRPRYSTHTTATATTAQKTNSKKEKTKKNGMNTLHRSCDVAGMLSMIRIQHHLHPLERCTELDYYAKIHCQNMISACTLHSSVRTVTELRTNLSSVHVGENIQRIQSAAATTTNVAQSMFHIWMNAPINRQNILSKQFTQYGSAIEMGTDGKYYCCQLFRTR